MKIKNGETHVAEQAVSPFCHVTPTAYLPCTACRNLPLKDYPLVLTDFEAVKDRISLAR